MFFPNVWGKKKSFEFFFLMFWNSLFKHKNSFLTFMLSVTWTWREKVLSLATSSCHNPHLQLIQTTFSCVFHWNWIWGACLTSHRPLWPVILPWLYSITVLNAGCYHFSVTAMLMAWGKKKKKHIKIHINFFPVWGFWCAVRS